MVCDMQVGDVQVDDMQVDDMQACDCCAVVEYAHRVCDMARCMQVRVPPVLTIKKSLLIVFSETICP